MPIYVPGKVTLDSGNRPAAIAGVAPTLDYRFARDRREIETVSLTDKLTFTRSASCAYTDSGGNLRIAGGNEPRFDHDPTTGESLGLLIEESRTNLITYSENFDDVNWGTGISNVASRIPNSDLAPNDTFTADKITAKLGVGECFFLRVLGSAGVTYTISCFVKKDTGNWFAFSNAGYYAYFDIQNGIKGTIQDGTASITPFPNGWYRCTWTPATTSFNSAWRFRIVTNNGNPAANGESLFLWGAQLEAGAFPTSYIPTVGTTVIRTESAVIDGTGVITGTYTMVEKPAGCAAINAGNIELQTGYTAKRVMVFPAALSAQQITDIRGAM